MIISNSIGADPGSGSEGRGEPNPSPLPSSTLWIYHYFLCESIYVFCGLSFFGFFSCFFGVEVKRWYFTNDKRTVCSLQKGNTPLHVGALMGHAEIIKLLLRSGADVNHQSECHGVSPWKCYQ